MGWRRKEKRKKNSMCICCGCRAVETIARFLIPLLRPLLWCQCKNVCDSPRETNKSSDTQKKNTCKTRLNRYCCCVCLFFPSFVCCVLKLSVVTLWLSQHQLLTHKFCNTCISNHTNKKVIKEKEHILARLSKQYSCSFVFFLACTLTHSND